MGRTSPGSMKSDGAPSRAPSSHVRSSCHATCAPSPSTTPSSSTHREAQRLAVLIRRRALATSVAAASVREIDRLNIYHATSLAIRRALDRLRLRPTHVVLDGKSIRTLPYVHTAVVGGDGACYSRWHVPRSSQGHPRPTDAGLGARHPVMEGAERGLRHPRASGRLRDLGTTRHHRRSFIPVRQLSLDLATADPGHVPWRRCSTPTKPSSCRGCGIPSADLDGPIS